MTADVTEQVVEAQADSSPASEVEHEQNTEAEKPINQEAVNKRINDITAQKYEEKARADALEKRLKELESQVSAPSQAGQEIAPPSANVEAPSVDLYYDNPQEYGRKLAEYNREIVKKELASERESAQAAERERQLQERVQQENAEIQRKIIESSTAHNINLDEVDKSAQVLNQRGLNTVLGDILLKHENVAPLMNYLAQNPAEYEQINTLSDPISIVRQLDSMQSKAVRRNVSEAPEPVAGLSGLPARESTEFERRCKGAVFIS